MRISTQEGFFRHLGLQSECLLRCNRCMQAAQHMPFRDIRTEQLKHRLYVFHFADLLHDQLLSDKPNLNHLPRIPLHLQNETHEPLYPQMCSIVQA